MELNNIRLLVDEFDECFEFYSETLGLNCTWGEKGGAYASFDIGLSSGLSLFRSDLMAETLGTADLKAPCNVRDKSALIIKVDDVDQSYRDLSGRGVCFLKEPADMTGWGIRVAHFRDPDNNLLEIWSELDKNKWDEDLKQDAEKFEDR